MSSLGVHAVPSTITKQAQTLSLEQNGKMLPQRSVINDTIFRIFQL